MPGLERERERDEEEGGQKGEVVGISGESIENEGSCQRPVSNVESLDPDILPRDPAITCCAPSTLHFLGRLSLCVTVPP